MRNIICKGFIINVTGNPRCKDLRDLKKKKQKTQEQLCEGFVIQLYKQHTYETKQNIPVLFSAEASQES